MAAATSSSSSNLIPKPHSSIVSYLHRSEEISKSGFSSVGCKSWSTNARTNNVLTHSVARDVPVSLSTTTGDEFGRKSKSKRALEMDPKVLWERYTEWLYQHRELGLYLDVSRIRFTDEFVKEMEPRFMKALKAMEELEKGAIANPDERRMVGHYWLRNPKLSPNSFLRLQIENTLEAISAFAVEIVGGKIKPPTRVTNETGEREEPQTGEVQILLKSDEYPVSMRSLGAQYISKLVKISGITIAVETRRLFLGGAIVPRSCSTDW